jgi:acyl-CoA thioesterase
MLFSKTLGTIAPRPDGAAGFSAEVGEDWYQGRAIFGGIVGALGSEAMRRLVPADRPLRGLDVTFVGPLVAGTVQLQSEILRVGRAVTTAQARVISNDQVAATLTGLYGAARPSALNIEPEAAPATRSVDELPERIFRAGSGIPAFVQHFDVRWAEGKRPYAGLTLNSSKAYMRHRDTAALTESHLVALIDCIWSPALQMLSTAVPSSSLNWRLEILRHDYSFAPQAWWRIDTRSNAAGEGYISQSSVVYDPSGAPTAFSQQLVTVFG